MLVNDDISGGVNRTMIIKAKKLAKIEPWLRY